MEDTNNTVSSPLLEKLRKAVDDNLTNEQFGVEELARDIGMSRSQLHRKLNGLTGQSVSQFIREYRLARGMELLKQGDLTAAEVADRVGFGSPSYFSKCFTDYYRITPGEVKNQTPESAPVADDQSTSMVADKRPLRLKYVAVAAVLIIIAAVSLSYLNSSKGEAPHGTKSLAILPFKNLSEDQRNEYFSEGVVEAIRTNLSNIGELQVISRTSVEQYRQSVKSARAIAQELGVSVLLEGSIQRDNDQIRVDVRLVDGITEQLVWAHTFDRELKDVFAIQTEIAQRVARELNAKLSPDEKRKIARADTDSPKAYDLYLKGLYECRTYTNRGLHIAIDLFEQAIAIDPGYARAYAYLANSHICLAAIFGAEQNAREALAKGKPFIDKALAIDPDLDEAHMLMGFYKLYNDWDFEGAESEYKQAVIYDHPDALALYADYLNFVQRHADAREVAEYLNVKHPYYPNSRIVLSYFYTGKLEEALAFSESRLKMFSNYYTFDSHGFLLLQMGRYDEAISFFHKAIALEGIRYPRMLAWTGAAYAKSGQNEKAMAIINELDGRLKNNDQGSVSFFIAVIYSALNDKRSALAWLNHAYDAHDMEMPWLLTEPQFYNLHDEPEFQALAKKLGLTQAISRN
jgi:TolB-like protein/AraC-like DNA-binding protein